MSEELSRTIAVFSVVLTIGGLALAVRSCRRPARVRIPLELAMLGVSLGALPVIAAVTGVPTRPAFAAGAVALGLAAGAFQGSHLEVQRQGARLMAQRSIPAIGAWGAGIIFVQAAGAASRAGVLEFGQALSYFGAAMSFGLLVGRQGVLNRLALASLTVLAAGLGAALIADPGGEPVAAQAPQPTPTPKILKPAGAIDGKPFVGVLENGMAAGTLVQSTRSQLTLEFTDAGGAVKGDGQLVLEGFNVGVLMAIAEGLGSAIGEGVGGAIGGAAQSGGAIVGGGAGSGGQSSGGSSGASALSPELANCRGEWIFTFKVDGAYDQASGKLSGTYVPQQQFANLRGCPARVSQLTQTQPAGKPQPWNAAFDGTTVTGTLTSTEKGTPSLPFSIRVPDEKKPVSVPPAVVSPVAGTAPPAEGDAGSKETLLPPPVDIEEITPKEGAGAAIIGLGAVVLVSAAATAQTAGTAPALEKPERKREQEPPEEKPREPAGPQPVTEENIDWAIQNIAQMAQDAGYGDIVRAIDQRLQAGDITPADLERLRDILKRRKELDEYLRNTPLFTESDLSAIVKARVEDMAWLAAKMGHPEIGWILHNPAMAARITAAIVTEGGSEVWWTAWDVASAVARAANTPGDTSTAAVVTDLTAAVAIEAAWQVVPGKVIEKGLGAVMGKVAGQEAKALAEGGREGLEAAGREGAEVAGREGLEASGREGLEASTRSGDDAARAAAREGEAAERAGAKAPGEPEVPGAPKEAAPVPHTPAPEVPPRQPVSPGTSLKEAPQGAQIPRERIREAGWSEDQLDDMQRVMKENNAVYGARSSNVDSLPKLENGTSIPKMEPIKAKTANDLDSYLGTDPKYTGEVTLRKPSEPPFPRPAAGAANADPLHQAVWDRFDSRAAELNKLRGGVEELERQGLVKWDRQTGLITNTGLNPDPATFGKSFGGDIDGVYLRDAKTGAFIPDTDPRAQKIYAELQGSKVLAQHRWETNVINDRVARGGEGALSDAVDLHRKLEAGHLSGKELTIEVGPNHVQVGPSNINDAEWGLDPDWLHTGGTPVVVDENLLGRGR
jgi:hypothetical protein